MRSQREVEKWLVTGWWHLCLPRRCSLALRRCQFGLPAQLLHEVCLATDEIRLVVPLSENWPFHCLACRQPLEHVLPDAVLLTGSEANRRLFFQRLDRPIDPPNDCTESFSGPSDSLRVNTS